MNQPIPSGYSTICVWPGTNLGNNTAGEFEKFIAKDYGVSAKFLEVITTGPALKDGFPVPDTGGRTDLFFAVKDEDVARFAVPRLQVGIRWLEDVLSSDNYGSPIYPARVFGYLPQEETTDEK